MSTGKKMANKGEGIQSGCKCAHRAGNLYWIFPCVLPSLVSGIKHQEKKLVNIGKSKEISQYCTPEVIKKNTVKNSSNKHRSKLQSQKTYPDCLFCPEAFKDSNVPGYYHF